MKSKSYIYISITKYAYLLLIAIILIACGGGAKTSKNTPQAQADAIKAAERLVNCTDTSAFTLQNLILEAKSAQSKYIEMDDTIASNEFDITFRNYIKQHNEKLAKELF